MGSTASTAHRCFYSRALYMPALTTNRGVAFAISQLQEPQWTVRQVQPIAVFIAER